MRGVLGALVSTLVVGGISCSLPEESPSAIATPHIVQPIINGHDCAADEAQSAVAILLDGDFEWGSMTVPVKTFVCTGTLIAPDVVMAAAHCFDRLVLEQAAGMPLKHADFYVSFQSDLLEEAEQGVLPPDALKASEALEHPDYDVNDPDQLKNGLHDLADISLLFLSKPISNVLPEIVITKDESAQLKTSANVQIAGWGQQSPDPQKPAAIKKCASTFINELDVAEMQIGADSTTARKCHGDSGGPTYLDVTTTHKRRTRVIGVTSRAYDLSDCLKGGVDTRVDRWFDWIDEQMRARCLNGKRTWCNVQGIIPPDYYDSLDGGMVTARDAGDADAPDTTDSGEFNDVVSEQNGWDAGSESDESTQEVGPASDTGPADSSKLLPDSSSAAPEASFQVDATTTGKADAPTSDAQTATPSPTSASADDGGCSCRYGQARRASWLFGALALAATVTLRRRWRQPPSAKRMMAAGRDRSWLACRLSLQRQGGSVDCRLLMTYKWLKTSEVTQDAPP